LKEGGTQVSHTILYLAGRAFTKAVNSKIREMIKNPAAYELFVGRCWSGDVRYPHRTFVADARRRRASTSDVYYLAYPLLSEAIDGVSTCRKVHLEVELCHWLGDALPFEEYRDQDEEEIGLPKPVFRLLQAGPLEMSGSEREAKRALAERGLRGRALAEAFVLNKLCNRRALRLRQSPTESPFPVWIAVGWGNYEGHVGYADFAKLDPASSGSLFSLFRRAMAAVGSREEWVLRTLDQLLEARETFAGMGRGATCMAISSQ
jgi:hypothetical protein